ncbi:MAG: hypothetical protein PVG17_21280 [Desulfobacterales bacterium]
MADIHIGDGTVLSNPKTSENQEHAFKIIGYGVLQRCYGVELVNIWKRPFKTVDLGEGAVLKFNADILESDFVVDLLRQNHTTRIV